MERDEQQIIDKMEKDNKLVDSVSDKRNYHDQQNMNRKRTEKELKKLENNNKVKSIRDHLKSKYKSKYDEKPYQTQQPITHGRK